MAEQFPRVLLTSDYSHLAPSDVAALALLWDACEVVNHLYHCQVYASTDELLARLTEEERDLFRLYGGPWSTLEDAFPPVVPGVGGRARGVSLYPKEMTMDEFVASLEQNARLISAVTVVERAQGSLVAVPYCTKYREDLTNMALLLLEAAHCLDSFALSEFLSARADGLISNHYRPSERLWLKSTGRLEVIIGPYDVDLDALFGYKAGMVALVGVVDQDATARLAQYASCMDSLERELASVSTSISLFKLRCNITEVSCVNVVAAGGAAACLPVPVSYNLPNDAKIREEHGTKIVILRNNIRAKYHYITLPTARLLLIPALVPFATLEAKELFLSLHELSHTLGPASLLQANGDDNSEVPVDESLGASFRQVEEAKADACAVFAAFSLERRHILPAAASHVLRPQPGLAAPPAAASRPRASPSTPARGTGPAGTSPRSASKRPTSGGSAHSQKDKAAPPPATAPSSPPPTSPPASPAAAVVAPEAGEIPENTSLARQVAVVYLVTLLRRCRLSSSDVGSSFQLNFLVQQRAVVRRRTPEGTHAFAIDFVRFQPALRQLVAILVDLECDGDSDAARAAMEQANDDGAYVLADTPLAQQSALDAIPLDIHPIFMRPPPAGA